MYQLLNMELGSVHQNYILNRTEILIYIANSKEYKGFCTKLKELPDFSEISFELENCEIKAFKYCNYHICYFFSSEIGPRYAANLLEKIGRNFPNLKYVVNIGCCATTSEIVNKEVIYANRVFDADLRKENHGKTEYAISENRHFEFSNKVKTKIDLYSDLDYKVLYAPLIASSAVIKDRGKKIQRIEAFPFAAGIEMEGVAISDYALNRNIEWMVIKGVSDDAQEKQGSKNQKEATIFASDLFFKILSNDALKRFRPNVFVGGKVEEKDLKDGEREIIEDNCQYLGKSLLSNNFRIISGYGDVVGPSLAAATYFYRKNRSSKKFIDYMEVSPFPRIVDRNDPNISEFYKTNRANMIKQCLIAIFVYGRNTGLTLDNGAYAEYTDAGSFDLPRFVIPSENYLSDTLFFTLKNELKKSFDDKVFRLKISKINNKIKFNKAVDITLELIEMMDNIYFGVVKKYADIDHT